MEETMRAKETLEEKQVEVQEIKSVSGEKFREYCEDISARTEWKREYHLEGIRKRIVLSSNFGEYRDENGDWKTADNSLERQEADREGFTGYATRQGGYQVRFPVNAKQAVLMQIREGESRVSFRLKERCRTASGRLASRKGSVENYVRASMDGERKCSGIGYRNIFPKADVKYDLENGKIKERIVVKEPQANYRYEFCIDTENAEVRKDEETGILRIYNGEKELFHIPEAYMEDANGEVSNAVEYELKEESAGRYTFAIVADAAWMNDEERVYPVVIDPTLIKESGVSCHCVGKTTKPKYNSTGSPCGYQTVYSTESTNRVGKSGDTIYRTYINFALLSEFEYDVTNAILRLELSSNAGGEYYVGQATSKSSATQIFIGNVPVRDVLTLKTEQNNGKTVYTASADITAIVRDWMNGGKNYGVELRGNESVNACIEIVSAQVLFTTQHQRAKASNSFQKNDAKRAGKSAVDLYSGRLMFEHSDFEFLSEIFPMKISHEYNSDLYYRNGPGMKLGYGWKLNLQQNISTLAAPSGFSSSGGTVYMYEDGNGVWHEISCKKYNLEKQKSNYEGSATRTVKRYTEEGQSTEMSTKEGLMLDTSNMMLYENNGVMSYFQHIESGVRYLTRTVYADKKQLNDIKKELNITYSGNKITKVTDGAGKTAQFAYNSSNYLTSITCEGKKISFSYTGDDLTKIVYPDNTFTTFAYDKNHLLTKVTDRSGYELRFEYGSGWYGYGYAVTRISELTAYETIGNGWKTPHCCNAILSGDSWSIHHSHSLQTQVKNRNGLTLEYIFDVDGNTVTMFEDDRAPTSLDKFNITGKANFRRSYLMEEKSAVTNGYKTRTQTIEAVMYNRENHLSAVENWVPTGMTYGDGTSSEAYVEGGRSYKVEGSLNAFKRLQTTLPAGVHENGIYVFGCWAKAENVIASVDTEYGNGNGRYFGLLVTVNQGSYGTSRYYASFDPYNPEWQMAAVAVDLDFTHIVSIYVEVIYARAMGTAYFDNAFAAKSEGGIVYSYDNNYTETHYHGYTVATLYDQYMNDVKNIIVENGGTTQYVTENKFDDWCRAVETKNYRGIVTKKTYDVYGNVTEQRVTGGGLTMTESNTYASGNYRTKSVNSDGSDTSFSYNADGGLKSSTLPNGQAISYAYDSMGQVKSIAALVKGVTNKNEISYQFGYVTQLKHGNTTYEFTYDGYGRVKTVKAGGTTILTNTYTDFGRNLDGVTGAVSRVETCDAENNIVTTYTDKYGRSLGSKRGSGARSVEEYDDADNLTRHIDKVAGVEYNYAYNEQRDVTSYSEKKGTSTRVQMSCTYDKLNRPKKSSYKVNGKSYSYACNYTNYPDETLASFVTPLGPVMYVRDGLNRLKERRLVGQCRTFTEMYEYLPNLKNGSYTTQLVKKLTYTGGTSRTLEYGYDANANIKTIKSGTSTVASYEYDGLNRLTRENIAGEKTVVYGYDNAGNLTSKKEYVYTTGALGTPTATKSYTYAGGNWGDRLTSYDGESIAYDDAGYPTTYRGSSLTWSYGNLTQFGSTTFSYNDEGIRQAKGATEYFVKGNQILAEKRGSTVIHYYYDDSGVAGFEYNGQQYYYRKNLQGDIVAICDHCGNLLGEYEYDAWGKILSQGGSELLTINPFRYRGYYYDTETGLYYLNSRYYDPETGRFISPDDVGVLNDTFLQPNGLNLYAYCYNNPVMMTDPDGAFTLTWWQKLLIGLAFIVLGAIATALSGGSFAAAFVCGLTFAAKSAVTGAVMGAVIGGLSAAFSGENVLEGALSGFADGFYDGFMWGGITAGLGNVIKPGSFCFVAGTKVLTDRGHKNIEDIEVGDLVLAYDEETGETAYKPVLHLFRNTTNEWCTVKVKGSDGELHEITSTPGHKYFVPENKVRKDSRALEHASYAELSEKWVSACDLKHGDKVLLFDGTLCKVESVSCRKLSAPETTYNLEVADFHTYYVSDACVLVHNNCRGDAVKKAWKQEREMVAKTGRGTRNWSGKQKMELLQTGKVKGFVGHHINSVKGSPSLAGDPSNIRFVTRAEHLALHGGNFRNITFGKLLPRIVS